MVITRSSPAMLFWKVTAIKGCLSSFYGIQMYLLKLVSSPRKCGGV